MLVLPYERREAVVFGIERPSDDEGWSSAVGELKLLLENLDVDVIEASSQKRARPDPMTFIGSGKAEEIGVIAREMGATLLVCTDDLGPGQRAELQELTKLEVWDWPLVIMKIFEARAHTAEAKLQVELARARYELPQLRGFGSQMSRTGGGIGTRGPGETEFERHRRKLERRVKEIQRRLEQVRQRREGQRKRRRRAGLPTVALVGYTNSGKTTLLRRLSHDASLIGEDRLFATLDPSVRRVRLPRGQTVLFSDTVGFVRRLPPDLVAAFRATLEEVAGADLLLLLLDVDDGRLQETLETVESTLKAIDAATVPSIIVLNKVDKVEAALVEHQVTRLRNRGDRVVPLSAKEGWGQKELLHLVEELLFPKTEGESETCSEA